MSEGPSARGYFDWAATAPQDLLDLNAPFANPSSRHREGRAAREALEGAREDCAAALGVPPETIYFTSGGTESNCIAIYSLLARQSGARMLASAGEHSSVRENARNLERLGRKYGEIPLDGSGRVTPELLARALEKYPDARRIAIMAVNNETGAISDTGALRRALDSSGRPRAHLHCDAVQALGKIPVELQLWGVDSASFSAHKIGGPRGIGILYLRKPIDALCLGGGQEKRVRAGTENVAGAMALARCMKARAHPEALRAEGEKACARMERLLRGLEKTGRLSIIPASRAPEGGDGFSPYIVQVAFRDAPGEALARALDDMGYAVSTGAACSSSSQDRPTLAAMGISEKQMLEGIRVSQGWATTDAEIDGLIGATLEALKFL